MNGGSLQVQCNKKDKRKKMIIWKKEKKRVNAMVFFPPFNKKS